MKTEVSVSTKGNKTDLNITDKNGVKLQQIKELKYLNPRVEQQGGSELEILLQRISTVWSKKRKLVGFTNTM